MCKDCKKPYYISTAIAYTSGKPHIGNTYEIVLADAIARYKREQGYDVYFQTGTDEHGQKIELKAKDAGVTPKEFVDQVAGEIRRIWDLMDTSTTSLSGPPIPTMKSRFRKFSRSFMIREIFTKDTTRAFTARPVNPSGRRLRWWTESARTADARYSPPRRKHTFSV